jgi:hypothetical protein
MTTEQDKQMWIRCELQKAELTTQLRAVTKEQRPYTRSIRKYMTDHNLEELTLGPNYVMHRTEVEHVSYSEQTCQPYMDAELLTEFKRQNTKKRIRYSTA